MTTVNIREFSHNLSKYLKCVKNGDRIVVTERNTPIADIIPHNENISRPGWKREIDKISLNHETLAETVVKNRNEEQL